MKFTKILIFSMIWLLTAGCAFAGMTTITLTDIASARIDAISLKISNR